MRIGAMIAAAVVSLCAALPARGFTLIEKLVPITFDYAGALPFQNGYVAWGGYLDAQQTQFFGGVELLPAVQRTASDNLVLTVPRTIYGFAATLLMGDGSVRVGLGMNAAGSAAALGPPAMTFNQFFANAAGAGTSESALIGLLAQGDKTGLLNFYQQNFSRLGSRLTTPSDVIGFSTATLLGHEQIIERPTGDANFDGTVNFTDLVTLAAHYGTTTGGTWAEGDFNGDGKINFADLVILAANYGKTIAPGVEPAVAPVPEPGMWGLLAVAGAVVLARIRR